MLQATDDDERRRRRKPTGGAVDGAGARLQPPLATLELPAKGSRPQSLILLPLLFVLVLPTFHLVHRRDHHQLLRSLDATADSPLALNELLIALLRLPIDKLRLQSGLMLVAGATQTRDVGVTRPAVGDLQEEETHMSMMAPPAEHRASGGHAHPAYAAAPADQMEQPTNAGGGGGEQAYGEQAGGEMSGPGGGTELAPANEGNSQLQTRNDLPAVRALNVKCEKNHMMVNIVFDRPFYGLVFSKGHYNDQKCIHLPPNSGQTSVNFDIHLGKCGMTSSDANPLLQHQHANSSAALQQPNGLFIENTIIIQYDPLVQEIYDQARKLRCTWYDYYEKSVTFRPYNVDMLDAVTANFLGDNIQCWMQIQVGKGPWSSEVAGIVKIGQTMTMVLAIKDDENRFDMLVRNCVAHDGKHQPIQLVDEYGCVVRPKIMSRFQKVKNFGPAATVVSYAHFQAFKFPDSMSVHFQCVIQVCRYECPEPACNQGGPAGELSASSATVTGAAMAPTGTTIAAMNGGGNNDYTASSTELVAAKETAPQLVPVTRYNTNNVANLKLDESQGKVQVRLDTSMMTGGQLARQPTGGAALPPHLLHAARQQQQQQQVAGLKQQAAASSRLTTAGNQLRPQSMFAAPPGSAAAYYSAPYPMRRIASAYAHRLGELHPVDGESEAPTDGATKAQGEPMTGGAPYDSSHPLSLLAAPRGLSAGSPALRFKRSITARNSNSSFEARGQRNLAARHLKQHEPTEANRQQLSSTSVATQRTIQVVSPDDVAFNLLMEGENETTNTNELGATRRRNPQNYDRQQQQQQQLQADEAQSSICFSTWRLLSGSLVALLSIAGGLAAMAAVIMRQRVQLEQKLSAVFDPTTLAGHDFGRQADESLAPSQPQYLVRQRDDELRQREELERRQTYLMRLYSQFSPATYWRQQ